MEVDLYPEGLFKAPQTGHLAGLEFKRWLERDAEARDAFQQQIREEKERRQALHQSREMPDTPEEMIEYFLDTEAQEIEFEIARLRPRLNDELFSHLKFEIGQLRFAVSKTEAMEDRLIELEALPKALQEGTEAYDKMQAELVTAKKILTKILTSKDMKATLLEMVECNLLNRSLLTLLDENIASAQNTNQKQAAEFMEKKALDNGIRSMAHREKRVLGVNHWQRTTILCLKLGASLLLFSVPLVILPRRRLFQLFSISIVRVFYNQMRCTFFSRMQDAVHQDRLRQLMPGIVLIGEIGGTAEEEVAALIKIPN